MATPIRVQMVALLTETQARDDIDPWVDNQERDWLIARAAKASNRFNWSQYPWSGVYFVRGGDLIKIGLANRVHVRVRDLRNGSPVPIALLGWIACDPDRALVLEASLHAQFASIRQHAEWFTCTPELERFIERSITACSWPRL